jgi:N-acetylneuraminic acid mutarotase
VEQNPASQIFPPRPLRLPLAARLFAVIGVIASRKANSMQRRTFLISGLAAVSVGAAGAQSLPVAPPSPEPFARFAENGALTDRLSPAESAEATTKSPAPAGPPGRWITRASLPVPTSEMGGGAAWAGRLHIVGGWIEHAEHYIYDPSDDRWFRAAPLPRTGNHIPVAADAGRVYALGGFKGPNTDPFTDAYAYEIDRDRWDPIAPLPRARGAGGAAVLDGRIHLVGGAAAPTDERASVAWHEAYDPASDSWSRLRPIPGARDHLGVVAYQGRLHIIGGRFNTSAFNTDLHGVYLPDRDDWELRAPMPTARSGHGLVVYRDRFFAMGGEAGLVVNHQVVWAKVFAQMESYDPVTDTWQHHAPMPTPRHGPGVATIGDSIYTVAGGPVAGGSLQAATNETFTLE